MHQSNRFKNQRDGKRHGSNAVNPQSSSIPQQHQNGSDPVAYNSAQNGECVVCKRNAVCVCQRCGDFYCSPDCQRNDWPGHRYICFPMPTLVRVGTNISKHVEPMMSVLNISKDSTTNDNVALDSNISNRLKQQNQPQQNQLQQQQQQKQSNSNPTGIQIPPPMSQIPKHNSRVLLTGFRSPNRCFIRSLAADESDGFMRVAKAIDSYGKRAPRLTQTPQPNSYAITYLDPNGVLYRVQILSARPNSGIRVLFLDNGNTAVRQLSELREICDEILSLQQYTVQIQLKNVENYALNDKLLDFLSQYEDCEFKLQHCKEDVGRGGYFILKHWQSDETLNDQITQFGSSMDVFSDGNNSRSNDAVASSSVSNKNNDNEKKIPGDGNQLASERIQALKRKQQLNREKNANQATSSQPKAEVAASTIIAPVMNPPFKIRNTLDENAQNVDVVVVDNSCLELGYIACVVRNDIATFAEVQKYLADFNDTQKPYKPCLNEYCIAKFEGDWYRAKVTGINKDKFTVLYIDYTNESEVSTADIRPYPSDLKQDCITNMCLIDGLPTDINEELMNYLQNRIPLNTLIKIDNVKSVDDQIIIIELTSLIEKMQSDGLL